MSRRDTVATIDLMEPSGDFSVYLSLACELAKLGADTARSLIGTVSVSRKADNTPVTEADHRVQAAILSVLAARYPTHAILVEETVADPERHAAIGTAEFCWVIDPIDGTRNFARGLNFYAVSIGLLQRGVPVVATILDVSSGRLFWAVRGGGAFCDGERIQMVDRTNVADTVLLISSFRQKRPPEFVAEWMSRFLFRNLGSICIHFTWLAAGFADGAYSPECKLWDLAAGALIVDEAGGLVTNPFGRSIWPIDLNSYRGEDLPIIAATPALHGQLLDSIKENRT